MDIFGTNKESTQKCRSLLTDPISENETFSFCVEEQMALAYHLEGLRVPQVGNHWFKPTTFVKIKANPDLSLNQSYFSNRTASYLLCSCLSNDGVWFLGVVAHLLRIFPIKS